MAIPQARSGSLVLDLPDEAATAALAKRLAGLAQAGDVIALSGDLGSGKTSFARAFINALPAPGGVEGAEAESIPSPTFTLVQIYDRTPAPVWHVDLYRLERPEEVYELGLEEALAEAITLIEWPDRLGPLLPAARLDVILSYADQPGVRQVELAGDGGWTQRLCALQTQGQHV